MFRHFFVNNFRKNASLRERFFAHFIFLTGRLRVVPRSNLLTGDDLQGAREELMVGDLVFVGSTREISRFFVRGVFSHVLIYTGKEELIHSNLKHGVTKATLVDLFSKYDYLRIYRPRGVTVCQIRKVIEFAKKSLGAAYDFRFLPENEDELYCTKLVYLAYQKAGIELKSSLTSHWLSFFSITHPADFILHNFTPVFSSQSLFALTKKQNKHWVVSLKTRISRIFISWGKI
jgi:hypothetical protein